MKKLSFIVTFVFLTSALMATEKHALIVAVANYTKHNTKWKDLTSINDVKIIYDALVQRGVPESGIIILNTTVTRDNILKALNELIDKTNSGDVVYFHFSGHGYQIPDNDGDETDGMDEALVPEDAIFDGGRWLESSFYKNYIRDDELGRLLDQIRSKAGETGNVFVTIDACHSGTITRGLGPHRGSVRTEIKNTNQAPNARVNHSISDYGLYIPGSGKAPMACIFASSENQLNFEYHSADIKCGSLSYAISTALADVDNNSSYRALYAKIKKTMASIVPRQDPHAEGEFDQVIFGGQLLAKPEYLKINAILNEKKATINAGRLNSINQGTIVGFYHPDTRDFRQTQPIAKGKVTSTKTIESTVEITDGRLVGKEAALLWVYPLEINYGDMKLTVRIDATKESVKKFWTDRLAEYPFIMIDTSEYVDLLLEIGRVNKIQTNEIRLTSKEDFTTYSGIFTDISERQTDTILNKMIAYAQANMLRGLRIDNPEMKVTMRLIPMKMKDGSKGTSLADYEEIDPQSIYSGPSNAVEMEEGSFFKVAVRNHSSVPLYFSILDIMPDNEIGVLFPSGNRSAQEFRVNSFEEWIGHTFIFQCQPPYGDDMLKIILTKKPLELNGIVASRGAGTTRGTGTPIENLLSSSYRIDEKTRGGSGVSLELEDIGIYDMMYKILPRPKQ